MPHVVVNRRATVASLGRLVLGACLLVTCFCGLPNLHPDSTDGWTPRFGCEQRFTFEVAVCILTV
jgi:hypothetical protein